VKVALVSYDFGDYCIRLANGLASTVDVLLLAPAQLAAPYASTLDARVTFHPFEKPRLRQPFRQLRVAWHLVRCIKAFDPDVIHLQQGHLWFNGFLPLLRAYPLVLTIHDPRHHLGDKGGRRTPQCVFDFGFRRASQLIVHALQSRDVIVAELRIAPDRIHVMPHVSLVDEPGSARPDGDDGHATALFFGRLWEYKGLEYLIRAEPLITSAVPNARIVIAGQGEDFARYRRLMVHPDRFLIYNQYVPDDRRQELFLQADVVVLPYVEASQSGVVPLAYASGKPVVATTVGGLPEIVDDGRTGYLVPPRDERALADAIIRLFRDTALRRQMGINGRHKLQAECAPSVIARQTMAVYHRALRDANAPELGISTPAAG
jgi:glycosyltransferase involved in cell wall biosynthesis